MAEKRSTINKEKKKEKKNEAERCAGEKAMIDVVDQIEFGFGISCSGILVMVEVKATAVDVVGVHADVEAVAMFDVVEVLDIG